MQLRMVVLFWVVVLFIEVMVVCLLVSPATVQQARALEKQRATEIFGEHFARKVETQAHAVYVSAVVQSGVQQSTRDMLIPKRKAAALQDMGDDVFAWVSHRLRTLWAMVEASLYRWTLIVKLLPYALPVLVPSLVDGVASREIRKAEHGYASPSLYHLAKSGMFSALIFPIVVLLFPFIVHPALIVVWCGLLPLLTWVVIRNVQNMV